MTIVIDNETTAHAVGRVAQPFEKDMPSPFDNLYSLARFRCAYFNYALAPLVMYMTARHFEE